jgi:hypothetical protein
VHLNVEELRSLLGNKPSLEMTVEMKGPFGIVMDYSLSVTALDYAIEDSMSETGDLQPTQKYQLPIIDCNFLKLCSIV